MHFARAWRSVRLGRDKSAYYRMWHVRQRAGLAYPDQPSPGAPQPFETALVALGKESGKLEECLRLLADYFAAEDRMVLKVLRLAAYPMMTALAATFIAPLPLAFAGSGGAYLITVMAGLALWATAGGTLLTTVMRRYLGQPRFVLARLLRALTFAVESGLPLARSAALAAAASGSAGIVAHVRGVSERAAATQPLASTFAGCPYVPATAIAAMKVADASGDYSGALKKMAELYDG